MKNKKRHFSELMDIKEKLQKIKVIYLFSRRLDESCTIFPLNADPPPVFYVMAKG